MLSRLRLPGFMAAARSIQPDQARLMNEAAWPMAKHRNRSQIVALKVQDTKLTDAFIRTLARDRQAHGEEVIQRVREDNPVACFKGMLSLVQKDVSLEGEIKRPQNPAGIRARTEKEAS